METEELFEMQCLDDLTAEEIARLVKKGYMGGILDHEDSGYRIVWKLNLNIFKQE